MGAELDRLNDAIARVEAKFHEMNLGRRASVPLCEAKGVEYSLAFGKLSNEWKLILETHVFPEEISQTPLRSASMEYRMLAPAKFNELLAALRRAAAGAAAEASAAAALAEKFLAGLDGGE